MSDQITGDLADETPVDMRQVLPTSVLSELVAGFADVLARADAWGGSVGQRAAWVAAWIAPRLAERDAEIARLSRAVEDARFDLNKALHAAVVESGVPVEGEIRRALRVHGITDDRELDACVVAVRRTLSSLVAEKDVQIEQAGAAMRDVAEHVAWLRGEVDRWSTVARQRHVSAQRLREELAAAMVDGVRFRALTPQSCPVDLHDGWLVESEHQHACPWCLVDQLRGDNPPSRPVGGAS